MAINNPLSTLNGIINITSGTGTISIGNDAVQKVVNLGNATGNSTMNIFAGTGGLIETSTGAATIDAAGVLELNSSAAAISIGNDAVAQAINIGTGAAARTITVGNSTGATGLVFNVGSAGISVPSFTTTGAAVIDAAGVLSDANASTAGFVLTSNGSGSAPSFQVAAPSGFAWSNVTGTSQAMAITNGYVANNAAQVVFDLPTTAAVGSLVAVQGAGAGGWKVAQGAGQSILLNEGASTVGVTGYLASSGRYDTVYLMCIVANTTWAYNSGFGNYDLV